MRLSKSCVFLVSPLSLPMKARRGLYRKLTYKNDGPKYIGHIGPDVIHAPPCDLVRLRPLQLVGGFAAV